MAATISITASALAFGAAAVTWVISGRTTQKAIRVQELEMQIEKLEHAVAQLEKERCRS